MALLQSGGYDWCHVAAHGSFYPESPDRDSAIWLEQDRSLVPQNLRGPGIVQPLQASASRLRLQRLRSRPPGLALTRIGGWANHLVSLKAGLFIAPLWIVDDSSAATFASAFYRLLLDGETVGRAVRRSSP